MKSNIALQDIPVVVVLGAGRPFRGAVPSSVFPVPDSRRLIDCVLEAFRDLDAELHFVAGYHADEIAQTHPELSYSFNLNWENTGAVGSLFSVSLDPSRTYYVCYSDIIFSRDVVKQVAEKEGDIVLAIDENWRNRYERRHKKDIEQAEKVIVSKERVASVGKRYKPEDATGEFAGLMKLAPAAMERLVDLRREDGDSLSRDGLPVLLEKLIEGECETKAVDVQGRWAELNAPQDIANYFLSTKAKTLERLRTHLREGVVSDLVSFTVAEWREDSNAISQRITRALGEGRLIVRSSALSEDSWESANAGVYESVLNVPGHDAEALSESVRKVIDSYPDQDPMHQVLVQNMLEDVRVSGVIFTRTLSRGAPYYVINFEETSLTDTVTGGGGQDLKMMILHRDSQTPPRDAPPWCAAMLSALREIEALVGHDSLDIEFAVDRSEKIHIFQLRPIAVDHSEWKASGPRFNILLLLAAETFRQKQSRHAFIVGKRTIFGVMPDWNPAEIIGTKPSALAMSLYRYLITDDVWAVQRAEYGYRDVRPQPLLASFAEHPYVDVRASFNSFIPAELPDDLAAKLVDHYLDYLESSPELHDKVEFEVVFTCSTFDFDRQAQRLKDAGFEAEEIRALKSALSGITKNGIERYKKDLEGIQTLEKRFKAISQSGLPPLERAYTLLEDCKRYGALPFSHLARGGFVAMALLKSAVRENLLSSETLEDYLQSISTVSKEFLTKAAKVAKGEMEWDAYVEQYGHLRPGTYEITSPSYSEYPEKFIQPIIDSVAERHSLASNQFVWDPKTWKRIADRLVELGLPADQDQFDGFVRGAIEGRERAKFLFTRNLSAALDAFAEFGETYNLSREKLAHIAVSEFWNLRFGSKPFDISRALKRLSDKNNEIYQIAQGVELPPLIFHEDDFWGYVVPDTRPNYVSANSVTAEVVVVEGESVDEDRLRGKIAIVPRADPGFDWLFGYGIRGLIAAYGGANSHMAIRAAEFNLPAVIGVGEKLYGKFRRARLVEIDCKQRRIRVVE